MQGMCVCYASKHCDTDLKVVNWVPAGDVWWLLRTKSPHDQAAQGPGHCVRVILSSDYNAPRTSIEQGNNNDTHVCLSVLIQVKTAVKWHICRSFSETQQPLALLRLRPSLYCVNKQKFASMATSSLDLF